jgi:hypothetical protein
MKHFFYKGGLNTLPKDILDNYDEAVKFVKKEISKILEIRNLSFLIGSGCSTGPGGIPTMKGLAEMFYKPSEDLLAKMTEDEKLLVLDEECQKIIDSLKIDCSKEPFLTNIETFLGTLYSLRFYYVQICDDASLKHVEKVIQRTKDFILFQCLNLKNKDSDQLIYANYKNFYRKLSLRDSNLPKPNIFTTNYDLYSEKAMDNLGITYANGFSGFIERFFNPAIFNYALAEQMDISSFKWNVIDSFIYLFKIHGSVNWVETSDTNKLFKIQEYQSTDFNFLKGQPNLMIYPSHIKQNASLGTPYSDLFREFQRRISQNQSVLVTMGYSFSDEHINNLIFQSLTIPTFRLVVFSGLGFYQDDVYEVTSKNIERLKALNDPRIWIIGSDAEFANKVELNPSNPLYFFSTISNELLPDWSENHIESKNDQIVELMKIAMTPAQSSTPTVTT